MTSKIVVPSVGKKITVNPDHSLNVPDEPIIPFIEGDGIGADITLAGSETVSIQKAMAVSPQDLLWMRFSAVRSPRKSMGPMSGCQRRP